MTDNIIELKQMFRSLSRLKVKTLTLPYKEYWEVKDLFSRYCDDGGSWNFQARFLSEEAHHQFSVFGVVVEHEGI